MGPDVRLLRALVTLADERHFGRAARRLDLSQPGLSRQIARLEREVGTRLFDRTSRAVVPTPAGLRLARRAGDALRTLDTALDEARAGELDTDPVHIGVAERLGHEALARLIVALRRPPGHEAVVHTGWSSELVDGVCRGALDVVLGHALAVPEALAHEVVALEPLTAHVVTGHPFAGRTDLDLTAFAGTVLLVPPRRLSPGAHDHLVACCRAAGFETTTRVPPVVLPPAPTTIPTALDARTFALAPQSLPTRPGAVAVPLSDRPHIPLVVTHAREPLRDEVTAVIDVLRRIATTDRTRTDVHAAPPAPA